ncbi:hypothetical protein QQF64_021544 [Cirrhinus molitorella]|uniref:Uncharacterized protein n=1 Tax=Cirrhinus molitorella TaxID=172907 RepID=A0ABR3L5M2_9TELE
MLRCDREQREEGKCLWRFLLQRSSARSSRSVCRRLFLRSIANSSDVISSSRPPYLTLLTFFCLLLPIAEHCSALYCRAHTRSLPSSPIIFNRACLLVRERACIPLSLSLSDRSRILVELL